MDFVAIDVETANEDLESICQIGIAKFINGKLVETFSTLVDPEDYFSSMNISIHGITEKAVRGMPKFNDIYPKIQSFLEGNTVVSHMAFDRLAINRASERYNVPAIDCRWLDSARIARRAWVKYAKSGYGLKNIAKDLGINFKHHDALEDAKAAGLIILRACADSNLVLDEWHSRVNKPINSDGQESVARSGNIDGRIHGEVIVFTGALNMTRHEAADLAAKVGCDVGAGVTKKTTILIVGDQDLSRLKEGATKSSKHMKAELLISEGHDLRILKESDFIKLVSL